VPDAEVLEGARARSCPLAKRLAGAFVGAARRADLLSADARPRRRVYALALPPLYAAAMGVRELDGAFYWRGVEEAAPAALRNAISRALAHVGGHSGG
jgi:hypothetical protein